VALLRDFSQLTKDRNTVHKPVECGYSIFEHKGERYLQLDTYGAAGRQLPGKTSQSVQLDASAAREMKALIEQTFPSL